MAKGLFVERIGTLEQLRDSALACDLEFVSQFATERRQREVLAWRGVVRREVGDAQIRYTASGAPEIADSALCISISHSDKYVAVVVSDAACGVDIDTISRNYSRVASRYASPDEQALSTDALLLPALWCAKESLYKYAGCEGLDFVRDIRIESVDFLRDHITARILGGELRHLTLHRIDADTIAVTLL